MHPLHHRPRRLRLVTAGLAPLGLALLTIGWSAALSAAPPEPSLVLITLDTTRNDFVGPHDGQASRTPALDRVAATGVRYSHALTPTPLTLPAHASLLTGLDPPEHGLRDNGSAVLPPQLPTLATVLTARGYRTGAVVATRVLDRRFGLARGFATYDDRMVAERTGEYGYPERDAAAVTTAALDWATQQHPARPFFLWVHYYDPHFPYAAPGSTSRGATERYGDEIAFMDREIGRLLDGLPKPPAGKVVAIVGDHGEALGEHGEPTHGVFIYRSVLEVPLIVSGAGVPRGKVVAETVATRRLGATLLRLLSPSGRDTPSDGTLPDGTLPDGTLPGTALPGLGLAAAEPDPEAIYSETLMPQSAYGWSPLKAVSDQRHRLIVAPRPELYDVVADPEESQNLVRGEPAIARQLRDRLHRLEAGFTERQAVPAPADGRLAAELRSLGYLSGGRAGEGSGLDPKDGALLLARQVEAGRLLNGGQISQAVAILQELNAKSPDNVPFLVRLASAQQRAGRLEAAIATFRRATQLQPTHEFLHHHLGQAYLAAAQPGEADQAFRAALAIDPRFAPAWLSLAEHAHRRGRASEEHEILRQAWTADVDSIAILLRLIQIETAAGTPGVEDLMARACELAPELPMPWLMRGRWFLDRGDGARARTYLEHAIRAAPTSTTAREARALLARIAS